MFLGIGRIAVACIVGAFALAKPIFSIHFLLK
jgi:KaiC/GvpD/RAD55 family RecA-like ATPase